MKEDCEKNINCDSCSVMHEFSNLYCLDGQWSEERIFEVLETLKDNSSIKGENLFISAIIVLLNAKNTRIEFLINELLARDEKMVRCKNEILDLREKLNAKIETVVPGYTKDFVSSVKLFQDSVEKLFDNAFNLSEKVSEELGFFPSKYSD